MLTWLSLEKKDQTVEVAEGITEVAEVAEVIIQIEDIKTSYLQLLNRIFV